VGRCEEPSIFVILLICCYSPYLWPSVRHSSSSSHRAPDRTLAECASYKISLIWHCPTILKGLSHEIFMAIFWLECIYLGLNGNRFWFFNLKEGHLVLHSKWSIDAFHTKPSQRFYESLRRIDNWVYSSPISFFCVSGPPENAANSVFAETCGISENDWQLILQFSKNALLQYKHASKKLAIQIKFIGEPWIQLSILLRDSMNL
jgi:hypothetical protein